MKWQKVARRWLAPIVLGLALSGVYAVTLAPGLTWANDGADGGDLIAAAATGGVAHPTGYPTFLILARIFLLAPWGSPALRVNLLSALAGMGASMLVADTVIRAHPGRRAFGLAGGVLGGFALGVSPLLWSQSVIAEVYSLHTCLAAASLWSLMIYPMRPLKRMAVWGGITGFALGNHLTAIFLVPVGLGAAWLSGRFMRWRALATAVVSVTTCALGLYALLPWWASRRPAINWGNAANWDGFIWVVTAEPYRDLVFQAGPEIWSRVLTSAVWLVEQFGLVGALTGLAGFFLVDLRQPFLRPGLIGLFGICITFAIGYNTADSYNYLGIAFLAFAVMLGLALAAGLESAGMRGRVAGMALTGAVVLLIFSNAIGAMAQADASQADEAERFGQAVLAGAPEGAIVVTSQDRDTFTLWYWREAARQRRDLIVLVKPLLPFAWYREQLQWTYPGLVIPDEQSVDWIQSLAELNNRPICRTMLDQAVVLDCSSP